jgi:hypothetical protein
MYPVAEARSLELQPELACHGKRSFLLSLLRLCVMLLSANNATRIQDAPYTYPTPRQSVEAWVLHLRIEDRRVGACRPARLAWADSWSKEGRSAQLDNNDAAREQCSEPASGRHRHNAGMQYRWRC